MVSYAVEMCVAVMLRVEQYEDSGGGDAGSMDVAFLYPGILTQHLQDPRRASRVCSKTQK
ncbi:hypothetical protein E2C01_052523 [Portunus trituberculatus]|uniref:Uncharacterized protein n=1 Tax=Portunus trituberculatus TaxID=210409 RepID=A0A5B7GMP7_PORTR|nr:hypothetical protein [Portunus trituberculatus]